MSQNAAIETTIRILEQSRSPAAQAILMHALSVDDQQIRDMAARALLNSPSAIAKTEVIRNIDRLSPQLIAEISQNQDALSFPLEQCVQHGDRESMMKALDTIESAGLYQELPFLVRYLGISTSDGVERAEQVLLSLVDQLYNERLGYKPSEPSSIVQRCEELLQTLGMELAQFEKVKRPRALIEAVLILADPQHGVARQLIRKSSTDCQGVVWDILLNSRHPGVLMFLVQSMNVKYVHPRILEIVSWRRDIEFQLCLVRTIPNTMSVNQERNFCQLQALPWLFPGEEIWQRIPARWQGNLVRLIESLAYRHEQKVAFFESALRYGSVEACLAAMNHRSLIRAPLFEQFVLEALESPDPSIEAWGVSELRNTSLPEKYRYLVNRLDGPCEQVRLQAREALGRFDVNSAILYCEHARPNVGPRIAELLLKINPDAMQALARELANPVRTRRLRAAKAVAFMRLQNGLTEALLEMLYDADSIVRRTVAEILADVPTQPVISSLSVLLEDSSPRVREAAQASLDKIQSGESQTSEYVGRPEPDMQIPTPIEEETEC